MILFNIVKLLPTRPWLAFVLYYSYHNWQRYFLSFHFLFTLYLLFATDFSILILLFFPLHPSITLNSSYACFSNPSKLTPRILLILWILFRTHFEVSSFSVFSHSFLYTTTTARSSFLLSSLIFIHSYDSSPSLLLLTAESLHLLCPSHANLT